MSIRGAHLPAFEGWHRETEKQLGAVTVTTWENPSPAQVIDDLVSLVDPQHLRVSRGETECPFTHGSPSSGSLGFGPAIPGDRFVCPGSGFVGASVVADLDYVPHRCIFAPPQGSAPLRLRFLDVRFGHSLHGHHALYVEAERDRTGAPVTLVFSSGGSELGRVVHRDGQGWKPFEFDTSALAGQNGELVRRDQLLGQPAPVLLRGGHPGAVKLPSLRLPERIGWRDHAIGAALAVVYIAWLVPGARSLGFPRDEGIYFRAGADYFRWWRLLWDRGGDALRQGAIDSAFGTTTSTRR